MALSTSVGSRMHARGWRDTLLGRSIVYHATADVICSFAERNVSAKLRIARSNSRDANAGQPYAGERGTLMTSARATPTVVADNRRRVAGKSHRPEDNIRSPRLSATGRRNSSGSEHDAQGLWGQVTLTSAEAG